MNRIFDKTLSSPDLKEYERVFLVTRGTTVIYSILLLLIIGLILSLGTLVPLVIYLHWWIEESDLLYYLIGYLPLTGIAEGSVLLVGYRELINLSELHILWTMKSLGYF